MPRVAFTKPYDNGEDGDTDSLDFCAECVMSGLYEEILPEGATDVDVDWAGGVDYGDDSEPKSCEHCGRELTRDDN